MAVKLSNLYEEIYSDYQVRLLTEDFFDREIEWVHIVEDKNFVHLLHGNELVFNSSLNFKTEEEIKLFADKLIEAKAGGLIVAMTQKETFPKEVIEHCNREHFPVLWAAWDTSYRDVMQCFSEILLSQERNATNLIAAMKNAIFYARDEERYLNHFERNGFSANMTYTILVVGHKEMNTDGQASELFRIEKSLRYLLGRAVSYEENHQLIILACGHEVKELERIFGEVCEKSPSLQVGIGSKEAGLQNIHISYKHALSAYKLLGSAVQGSVLSHDDMGVYQILTDVEHPEVCEAYLNHILGKLLEYDRQNNTGYVGILEAFFENECSLLHTAKALYCHKNTLYHKMNVIKEILGYNIVSNENRARILLAFQILHLIR